MSALPREGLGRAAEIGATSFAHGSFPTPGLLLSEYRGGNSRASAIFMVAWLCFALACGARAQTNHQQFLSFGPSVDDGSAPRGRLLEASDGVLYGTTYQGGATNLGTVFRVSTDGTGFSVLHSFTNLALPFAGLIEGASGNLYGTTAAGGTSNAGGVFRLDKNGSGFSVLHNFASFAGDGNTPLGGVILGSDGALYGATAGGGASNLGCIFRLGVNGDGFSILHYFSGPDGSLPAAGLLQTADGMLYGTTKSGGSNSLGTVFAMATNGTGFVVLHHFAGTAGNDGSQPMGALVETGGGVLYSTTYGGGNASSSGTIFKIATNGTGYAVVHAFQGGIGDGAYPVCGLERPWQGNVLFGTTSHGGPTDEGTAFGLNADGTDYSVLHAFSSALGDGSLPFSTLLGGSDGVLYGSTYFGGAYATNGAVGTLFKLMSGPPQLVITSITSTPGGVALTFGGGAAGRPYHIQAAGLLSPTAWQPIGTNSACIDGSFSFFDTTASNHPVRFYRGVVP